jgi:putative transposase
VKLVAKLKLAPDAAQAAALLATMERFNAACDWLAGKAFEDATANTYLLQRRDYGHLRADFGLGAQMAGRVIAKVSEAYKRDKTIRPTFKPHEAIVYDQRNASFPALDRVSLSTLAGRLVVPFLVGAYQRALLDRLKGQADLVYEPGKRRFFLYATVDVPTPAAETPQGGLGIDLGIVNLAADSDGTLYAGAGCNGIRRRHHRLRQRLQKKGTRSATRLLKHRRRKEQRFQADGSHVLSKKIVQHAAATHRAIALEDLEGIRSRGTVRRGQRRVLHGWAFAQLRRLVEDKAALRGVTVVAVDPRHTSRTCPACGLIDKANRTSQARFVCIGCGFAGPADHIAAQNIAALGRAAVMLPHAPLLSRPPVPGAGASCLL